MLASCPPNADIPVSSDPKAAASEATNKLTTGKPNESALSVIVLSRVEPNIQLRSVHAWGGSLFPGPDLRIWWLWMRALRHK